MSSWWPRHDADEIAAVTRVLESGRVNYWTGDEGARFEEEYAAWVGVPHAVTVSNGTVAIEAALRALRLPPGAEVIVPCRTFVACAAAVVTVGLTPVLADIGGELNVTAATVRARITPCTAAVLVVHYGGLPVGDLAEIVSECRSRRIAVIEDCAHAHGARVGLLGDISCWSFCQGKLISTGGEGGMITTPHALLADRVRAFRDHGRFQMTGKVDTKEFQWTVEELGSNLRMTEMQCALGRIQLPKQNSRLARRREIAAAYDEVTDGSVSGQRTGELALYLYLFHARNESADDRLKVSYGRMKSMRQRMFDEVEHARWGGCTSIVHEKACKNMLGAKECTDADAIGADIVSLPIYHTMTDAEVSEVCGQVRRVLNA